MQSPPAHAGSRHSSSYFSSSQTLASVVVHRKLSLILVSGRFGVGLIICISDKNPREAAAVAAAGPGTAL